MGCGCKKRRQQQLAQQQPPTTIHLPSGKIEPMDKPISEEEKQIIEQIKEELMRLHEQDKNGI